jgi:serine/threonine protein kinase
MHANWKERELRESYKDFKALGSGVGGTVYEATNIATKKIVAVKDIRLVNGDIVEIVMREITLIVHDFNFLKRILDVCSGETLQEPDPKKALEEVSRESIFLVMNHMGSNLRKYMESKEDGFSLESIKVFSKLIADA